MFPPSDSDSLEQPNENLDGNGQNGSGPNGNGSRTASADEPRSGELIPFGGLSPAVAWPYGYPTRPEILSAKPDISNLLHCLRRRKWLALFLGLMLGGAFGAAAWILLPTKFESTALLQVHMLPPSVFKDDSSGAVDFMAYRQAQVAAIKSGLVMDSALNDKSIADSPIIHRYGADASTVLSESLNIVPDGEFVKVSLKDVESRTLSEIANAVVDAYMREIVDKETYSKRQRRNNLETQVNNLNQTQLKKMHDLDELSHQIGTNDSELARTKKRIAQEQLETLMRSKGETEGKIADLDLKINLAAVIMKNVENNSPPDDDVDDYASKDPRIQQANNEISQEQHQLTELQKVMKNPNAPEIVRVRDSINSVQRTIEELKNEDRQAVVNLLRRNNSSTGMAVQNMKVERQLQADRLKDINAALDAQATRIEQLEQQARIAPPGAVTTPTPMTAAPVA